MKILNKKHSWAVLALLLAAAATAPQVSAQQADDYAAYSTQAREQSMLYRGRRATSYANVHYNGTYHWSTPKFKTGTVSYNGKVYEDVLVNIDAVEHELLVRYTQSMPEVVVDRGHVDWFTIGEQKYINGELSGIEGAKGYYLVLSDKSNMLLQQVRKHIKKSAENVNGDAIGYKDPNYNANIHSYFAMESIYYAVKDGRLKKITRRKAKKMLAYDY